MTGAAKQEPVPDRIAGCLAKVHDAFEDAGIWHTLIYGTLLGALRDGDVIAWDHDFDFLVRPQDIEAILALNPRLAPLGISFWVQRLYAGHLPVNLRGIGRFTSQSVSIYLHGKKVGDLYAFSLFGDGVLRRFDFGTRSYWCPHSSFPAWFVEELGTATIRGKRYPIPRDAEKLIEGIYGDDWRVPYEAAITGGVLKPGVTIHSDRYEPKLLAEIAWCEARGWDRTRYRGLTAWPQAIDGGGPRGPTERTAGNSEALWWRSIEELQRLY